MKTNVREREVYIKFKNQQLSDLRKNILRDLDNECYAVLIGKTEIIGDDIHVLVHDIRYTPPQSFKNQTIVSLKIDGMFVQNILNEIERRFDVDTLIEVHTHPFSAKKVAFSGVDDFDETNFTKFLKKSYSNVNYGSIVFSQTEYSARMWIANPLDFKGHLPARIKTQKISEQIKSSDFSDENSENLDSFLNRSELLFGKEALSKISNNQLITIVGAGGIGSVIAENLIHMGFKEIALVDHDKAELSNLNRFVGMRYTDAIEEKEKVSILERHLKEINPNAKIHLYNKKFEDIEDLSHLAKSSWIIMATDNHYSRYLVQEFCFKYYIPFIHVGVNISFYEGKLHDISGENVIVRMGDKICLSCLNILKPNEIYKVLHPDETVRKGLVSKGYVTGADIKEPAVKTLNSIMGALTVDLLMNEYTGLRKNNQITVYENNDFLRIYSDDERVNKRKLNCSVCDI